MFCRCRWVCIGLTFVFCNAYAADKTSQDSATQVAPNIVIIFADDMGYGDIKAYNGDSKIDTPHLDKMALNGMMFKDAHTSSAVCTPSRYSLLTGQYAWRTSLKRGVLGGHSPLLIEQGRETIASMLQSAGYKTLAVGKWHLGIGHRETNYWGKLVAGPNSVGFDYFFGIPASLDMEPYVYVENQDLASPLKGAITDGSAKRRDGGGGFWRKGLIGEGFKHQDVLSTLTEKAMEKITEAVKSPEQKPFFLYFPLPAPHTPWLPSEKNRGKSGAGYYGDFVADVDGVVGQINQTLADLGIADNTIVIYSSDNGAHWMPSDIEKYDHLANGHWRGQKADIYEGGHRVPLIINWPAKIAKGQVSHATIVLNDIVATLANIVGVDTGSHQDLDSADFSPLLFGQQDNSFVREPIIHHSFHGMFAIRKGKWKLIEGIGGGGFMRSRAENNMPTMQLYDLDADPQEQSNLILKHPQIASDLLAELNTIRSND